MISIILIIENKHPEAAFLHLWTCKTPIVRHFFRSRCHSSLLITKQGKVCGVDVGMKDIFIDGFTRFIDGSTCLNVSQ